MTDILQQDALLKRTIEDDGDSLAADAKRAKVEELNVEEPKVSEGSASVSVSASASASGEWNGIGPDPSIPKPTVAVPAPQSEPDMENLPQEPIPIHQKKHAIMTIKAVKRLKDAKPFLHPVDIVALNIPFYYNYVPRPMDLSTIERKLSVDAYESPEKIVDDFNAMVQNSSTFNGPAAVISQMSRNIQAAFEKHMLNMPAKDAPVVMAKKSRRSKNDEDQPIVIRRAQTHNGRPKREIHPPKSKDIYPYENKRPKSKKLQNAMKFCQGVVKELMNKKYASFNYPFLEPVDPVALNLPTYAEYVKEPMDLGSIYNRLSNWEYPTMEEFEHDVRLVFKNCYSFNPDGTIVNMMGHRLEEIFNNRWADRPIYEESDSESETNDSDGGYYSEPSDSDVDETLITNPAIQYLEEQLTRMKVELQLLKKQELDKIRKERRLARGSKKHRSKKSSSGRRRRTSKSNGGKRKSKLQTVVTYDMKRIISEHINDLSAENLNKVIKIAMPNRKSDDEEVELDLDTLDNDTLLTLYNSFFRQFDDSAAATNGSRMNGSSNRENSSLSPSTGFTTNGRKKRGKALSQEQQSKQIEKIRNKLAYLDHASPLSQNASPTNLSYNQARMASSMSSSSSSDDDDESESEEE